MCIRDRFIPNNKEKDIKAIAPNESILVFFCIIFKIIGTINKIINNLRSKRLTVKVTFNNQERLEDLVGRISSQIEADSLDLLNSFKTFRPTNLSSHGYNDVHCIKHILE